MFTTMIRSNFSCLLLSDNIVLQITEDKLRNTFSTKGTITDLQLKKTKDGKFRGFAFVGFKTEDEATHARNYFNGTYLGAAKSDVQTCSDLGESVKFSKKEIKQVRKLTDNFLPSKRFVKKDS